jgi:thymidylate synthase ThyX
MQIEQKYLSGHNQITAEVIADSVNPSGDRLTTFVLQFPRIVLAEFNTHRAVSRNSASSRAIPFKKMLEKVNAAPFVPIAFQKEHTGMQGSEYMEGEELKEAVRTWLEARDKAVEGALKLSELKVTKQLSNRVLEPFLYHTVIGTATNWENFFALRAHEAAEIHISDLAYKMLGAYNSSSPKNLNYGEYHIPFGDRMEEGLNDEQKIKVATSRCARVSYDNFEGDGSVEKDFALFDRLSTMGHWSPFEHVAQVAPFWQKGQGGNLSDTWKQLRKTFIDENKRDPRVIK